MKVDIGTIYTRLEVERMAKGTVFISENNELCIRPNAQDRLVFVIDMESGETDTYPSREWFYGRVLPPGTKITLTV